MEIKAKEIKLVPLSEIKCHPKNPNKHPKNQIERLIKIIKAQGFRRPLTISNQSGYLISGHGRLEAAKKLGMKQVPVIYQDYESHAQEYADMVADNAVDDWSNLNLKQIELEVGALKIDIDLLGIKNFALDISDSGFEPLCLDDKVKEHKTCPHCGEEL